jgi:hypothetical protein
MNLLDQLQGIFTTDGFSFQREDDQFLFRANCGLFDATFRVFETALVVVLIGEIAVHAPPGRRIAVIEFCNAANFVLLTHGNLEMDLGDGQVQLRQALMLPFNGGLADSQLRFFISSATRHIAILSPALAQVAINGADPQAVVAEMKDAFRPTHPAALRTAGFDSPLGNN